MTKQYTYIEYEKLSDAVRDLDKGQEVYFLRSGIWSKFRPCYDPLFIFGKYAKRVEVKEKTVEAWALLLDGKCAAVSMDRYFKDIKPLEPNSFTKFEIVPLTGNYKD